MSTQNVTFKTLTQESFTLELQEEWTIADVKAKVEEVKGAAFAVDLQKMIYNGKVLENEMTVKSITFEPTKYVIVMCARPKPATPPAAPVEEAPAAAAAPAAAPAAEPGLTPDQIVQLEVISSMGYPRDQALAALRAAFFNGERAVEFLINGIPDGVEVGGQNPVEQQPAAGQQAPLNDEAASFLAAISALGGDFHQLDEIRDLIQNNPERLGEALRQIATINPRLVEMIQNNQQGFLDLLNNPERAEDAFAAAQAAPREPNAPRRQVIYLEPAELEAINRLKAIVPNVSERTVVEAYLACDKNEEAAMDFIFSNMD